MYETLVKAKMRRLFAGANQGHCTGCKPGT